MTIPQVDVKDILKDLNAAARAQRAQIPSDVFQAVYLPMFMGLESLYPVDIDNWINKVAGSISGMVDIVENGVVILTVPPIMDTKTVAPTSQTEGRTSIFNAMLTMANIMNISSEQAQAYWNREMEGRLERVEYNDNMREYAAMWGAIMTHYGVTTKTPESVALENIKTPLGEEREEDF